IGDICNAQQGTTVGGDGVTYVVQTIWSNSANSCVASGPKPKTTTTAIKKTTTTAAVVKTTTAAVKTTTVATTCGAHSKCVTGVALRASSCDPCVGQIIAQDSYCGSTSWDSVCVGEVKSICGITC
ncbi:hypothetical protein HDU99_009805, partial [Rhizoclosmatium hyalinum]